ncbi:MAG: hypothetical protein WAN50_00335 [Minisyncoccia bacterium]
MAGSNNKSVNDELMTAQNIALLNLLFWHQLFLEGVRTNLAKNFDGVLRQLYAEFKRYLSMVRYQTLDSFTKAEMNDFIRRFKLAQMRIYSVYTAQLIKLLQQFVDTDVQANRLILEAVTGKTFEEADAEREHTTLKGVAGLTPGSTDSLWASILTDPIPANGMTIEQMLQSFVNTSTNKVAQYVRMAYANGWTKDELITQVFGSSENNWRDGYFGQLSRQNNTMVGTAVQHSSSIAQGAVTSTFLATYVWVSVIDGHTTEICYSRNGKVYTFGEGPIPPAHYGCRSKVVGKIPNAGDIAIPATFAGWLATQPTSLVDTMLGSAFASSLRSGSQRNVTLATTAQTLTIAQFLAKIKQLLGAYQWR